MIGDPQRLQYLEAMGITAWASRYRMINAAPTEKIEWETPVAPEKPAPGQRLQALLETPASPAAPSAPEHGTESRSEAPVVTEPAPTPSRARALLEGSTTGTTSSERESVQPALPGDAAPSVAPGEAADAPALADPLRFTLSLAVIGGRWWLLLPEDRPLSSAGQALLGQMLKSISLPPGWSTLSRLSWPLMDVGTSDPEGEAREGIQVFCAGQARRHELAIDGAIVVGDEAWSTLLNQPAEGDGLTYHALPHPDDLLASAAAKRECWPRLQTIAGAWQDNLDRTR